MFHIKIAIFLIINAVIASTAKSSHIFSFHGNVSVAVILHDCDESSTLSYTQTTLLHSAIWTVERINFLETVHPLKMGLSLYRACTDLDYLKTIFEIFQNVGITVGVVTDHPFSDKVRKFSEVLGLRTKVRKRFDTYLVRSAVQFFDLLGWKDNITLITPQEHIIDMFYFYTKKKRMCLTECYIYEDANAIVFNSTSEDPVVFFGTAFDIEQLVTNETHREEHFIANNVLFVPLDGDLPNGIPEGTFLVLPPHITPPEFKTNVNVFPTPLLFEIADPLISFAIETRQFMASNCNDTIYKINCLRNKPSLIMLFPFITPAEILKFLKIDQLDSLFSYDIYKAEKSNDTGLLNSNIYLKPYKKVLNYNVFYDNFTVIDDSFEPVSNNSLEKVTASGDICPQEFVIKRNSKIIYKSALISFRNEAWIYAFLSLSLLGVIFCIAILIFLLMSLLRRRILEGNPVLTLLLLCTVMLIFCAILPFSIESNHSIHKVLCIVKTLWVTMGYSAMFSLLLSRCIVLSSAAKEIGFMSHIAGPVQSFLCLFIFGVQAALSLHILARCNDIFTQGYDFIYLMSYNTMLLILLICLAPLVYKSQRNYREGKYFTIAIILITIVWCIWLPGFALLCTEWKEMMVCLGLVGTGGILLGTIFIPRTYLMTIAAERDKITSALPSLNAGASAMDIYRAHSQPIYDCVNVAAINAANVARAGAAPSAPSTNLQQPDLYSCPALPEDLDFDLCCDSPANTDKVTRF
ncbi:protein bride of sevenless [Anthonomus grandis grandis]|uniref:protein bride of sevenless n=1 Tax=Anthonomus grandis grandis TaxID=2921223 RepID=UPI0021662DBF|nr:protein bride of sevenless [Anthonomus grandis grandis]